jgi:hypothetical protein
MRGEDSQQEGIWKETSVVYTRVIYLPGNTTNITISEGNWLRRTHGTVDQPLPLYLSTRPEGWSPLQRPNVEWTVVKAPSVLTFQTLK